MEECSGGRRGASSATRDRLAWSPVRGGGVPPSAGRLRAARLAPESRYKINTCFAKTDFDLSTPELVKLDGSC